MTGLLDFVDHLADWASGIPLLIVATARTELLTRRPSWGGGKPNAVTISLSPLERSVELAATLNLPELGRAYNSLAASLEGLGQVRRGVELRGEAARAAEKFGNRSIAEFASAAVWMWDYSLGNWDRFTLHARSFLEESDRRGGRYQDAFILAGLARIATARGEETEALTTAARALDLAPAASDPQIVQPVLGYVALVELEHGQLDAARAQASEAVARPIPTAGTERPEAMLSVRAGELGIERELRAIVDAAPSDDRWAEAIEKILDGDHGAAADVYAEIGVRPLEARTRLRAAEQLRRQGRDQEATDQLERALGFWRSVGATRYVRSAESLLAPAAERAEL
jgi:tetratricopeptide (TPR) repeat protein